jgi:hypothetical protein
MGVVRGSIPRESISFCRPLLAAFHGVVGWVEFFWWPGLRIGVAVVRALVCPMSAGLARTCGLGTESLARWAGGVGWGKAGRVRVRLVFLEGVCVWVVGGER